MFTMMRNRRRRRANGDRAAALVEFVLLAPVLIIVVAGVLEFGMAWRDSMTVSNALRSGARVGPSSSHDRAARSSDRSSVMRVVLPGRWAPRQP